MEAQRAMETTREPFERVAILGLGLMGASLGMALRAAGVARLLTGYDPRPGVAKRARARMAIDLACADVSRAVSGADLVILAAPIRAAPDLFSAIAPCLASGALVTDLCSVKTPIVAFAEQMLPDPSRFIGGHPMTGSERAGVEAARAELYAGCVWALTPTERTAPETVARLSWMISRLGATPLALDPTEHDAAVALVSHLPRVAASALVLTAAQSAIWPVAQGLAAGGFRDSTRVASGDPAMTSDICGANGPEILASLDAYIEALSSLRAQIAHGDGALEDTFAGAKERRDDWLGERGSASVPRPDAHWTHDE
jgi:prephenate dehydrogenase